VVQEERQLFAHSALKPPFRLPPICEINGAVAHDCFGSKAEIQTEKLSMVALALRATDIIDFLRDAVA
jgi:hypothetical protein